jgi:hypothetical protein
MPQISKAQIEALEKLIMCPTKSDNANKALVMLQGLLDQPEGEPTRYRCADCKTPLRQGYDCGHCGSFAAEEINEVTHPPAPFTADDITAEMMANFIRGHTDNMTYAKTFAAAVNAYLASCKPITADDITDEMWKAYYKTSPETTIEKSDFAAAVNAYMKGK